MRKYTPRPPPKIICPHPECFTSFPLWDMRFQDTRGNVYPPYRPHLASLRRLPPRYAVGQNGELLRHKVCPRCLHSLPYTAGEQEDVVIGLVGAEYSGKSHFVAALLDRLVESVGRTFNPAIVYLDEATATRSCAFRKALRHGHELPVHAPYTPPLLYHLMAAENKNHSRPVTLAVCDTSGKNFNTQDDITEKTRYLTCASGLIFLIDPLQLLPVQQLVSPTVQSPALQLLTAPNLILGRVVQELSRHGLVERDRKLTTPVAVALTKCDVLRDAGLLEPHCLWYQDVHHEGNYNLRLHNELNDIFSAYLKQWDPAVWTAINTHFKHVAYFGLTATGCSADEQGRFARIAPWRVEEPLLWLLYQAGLIPGSE